MKQHQTARQTAACPERADLEQGTPPGRRPSQQCCIRCCRVTARRDGEGMPWCGGQSLTEDV